MKGETAPLGDLARLQISFPVLTSQSFEPSRRMAEIDPLGEFGAGRCRVCTAAVNGHSVFTKRRQHSAEAV